MTYRWVEHTAEVELEIALPTDEGVFADALRALGELLGGAPLGQSFRATVALDV